MREIGLIDLLTPEQEVKLAEKIREGDDPARHLMIKANLRLVVKIARDYSNFGLPLNDIISEGNIGLIKAVDRFDPRKGGKFSTYAAWWIKQSIRRALARQSKTIGFPVHLVEKIARIRRITLQLSGELGRDPTDEEVASQMGLPAHKVAHLKSVSVRPASLDAPVGVNRSISFSEIIGDENALNPFENLSNKSLAAEITQTIGQLDEREEKIIRLRFGLDGEPPKTLEEVGRVFGITRERIRQLQNASLMRMRRMMDERNRQRTRRELEEEKRQRRRMRILKDFFDAKRKEREAKDGTEPPGGAGAD